MERIFRSGDIVRHFKYETLSEEEKKSGRYTYRIVGIARHSETEEELMVYQALYGEKGLFVRPLAMFLEEVDHRKYPEIRQKYRIEKM
ncbi:MAG: DUF1653 domain-containing protein [Erysipelotrichaceae bacterium]|nr:DUF1653 domain-containing protein [Erysipelotrichaceae bacterium]